MEVAVHKVVNQHHLEVHVKANVGNVTPDLERWRAFGVWEWGCRVGVGGTIVQQRRSAD